MALVSVSVIAGALLWRKPTKGALWPQVWEMLQSLPKTVWVFLILTFIQGFFSAPNTSDAMAYHLPRVLYWVQEGTIWQEAKITAHDFMPPLGSAIMGYWYLLLGGDRLVFLGQWLSYFVTVVLAGGIASRFFGNHVFKTTALWTAIIPMALLQASSTQVDLLTTALALSATWFTFGFVDTGSRKQLSLAALSLALGLMVKPTFIFWVLGPLVLLLREFFRDGWKQKTALVAAALSALSLQVHWMAQNVAWFGTPLGKFVAESGTISFNNQPISVAALILNTVRNTAMHLPVPILGPVTTRWLESVFSAIGLGLNDPRFTWPGSHFAFQSVLLPQEDIVANPIHLVLFLLALCMIVPMIRSKKLNVNYAWLYGCAWAGFLLFSLVLKWQPYHGRLQLPFFVLMTVLSVPVLSDRRWMKPLRWASIALGVILVLANVNRPFISYKPVESLVRPYMPETARVPTSIFSTAREEQYFHARINLLEPYRQGVDMVIRSYHQTVELRFRDGFIYPFWKLLLDKGYTGKVVLTDGELKLSF